jgi:hypothetical protein
MEGSINLLRLEKLTEENLLRDAGLSTEDARFSFDILTKVFSQLVLPPNTGKFTMHPLARTLLSLDSAGLKEVFTLSVELEEAMRIPNHQRVLDRLRSNELDSYLGARGEIKAGAWAKNGLSDVEFIVPKSKKGKTVDLRGNGDHGSVLIEVKSENQFDLSIGMNNMFKGWVHSDLIRLIPLEEKRLHVSFGAPWVDAIGAACRINQNITGASWAFHSVVMAISTNAAQRIYNCHSQLTIGKTIEIDPDIECTLTAGSPTGEDKIRIDLPDSTKLATVGRIIRDITNPQYLKQAGDQDFIFFFYIQEEPDNTIASTMLANLFLQAPDLEQHCLGLVVANAENHDLFIVNNHRGFRTNSERQDRWSSLHSAFKKPRRLSKG